MNAFRTTPLPALSACTAGRSRKPGNIRTYLSAPQPCLPYNSPMRQVVLYPDTEEGGRVAEVPSLPGCISEGNTKEEALMNVRDAIETYRGDAEKLGRDVPDEHFGVQTCVLL